jgi:uncharacterized protein YjiS (DUF1127 family)
MFSQRLVSNFRAWRARESVRSELQGLSDRQLADIGISRSEIDAVAAGNVRRNTR